MIYSRPTLEGDVTGSTVGPAIVSSVGSAREIKKPFVLLCPSCTAPTPEGNTKCRYCGVPLTWKPVVSPMAIDPRPWEESDDEPGVIGLSFGPREIGCFSKMVFQSQPQLPIRLTHLYVPAYLAEPFAIADVRIGIDSWMVHAGAIPATMCSSGKGLRLFEEDTHVTPGLIVSLTVENTSPRNAIFHGVLRGLRMPKALPSRLDLMKWHAQNRSP